jgi:hypothetical protein
MVTLHRARNWKVEVFGREHGIAHVHVTAPDFRATITINSGEIIAGSLPASVIREVRKWLHVNRESTLKLWKARNPNL